MEMKNLDFNTREGRQAFYQSKEWRILRRFMLSKEPLCDHCLNKDRITPASEVHHKRDIQYAPQLRLDVNNLTTLCKECHSKITASESSNSIKDMNLLNRKWVLDVNKMYKPK